MGVEDTQSSSTNVTPSSHSRLCQPTQALCSTPHSQTPRRVIIAGALSFVGSRLAAHLTANGLTVYGFASTSDTILEDRVIWYRKEQLAASGVAIEIIDPSNETQLERKLITYLSEDTVIVYVPTLDTGSDSRQNSHKAEQFVKLLELARKRSPCTEVMLISDLTETTATWTDTFELLLSSYHSVYDVPMTILRVSGVYGPWSDAALSWYHPLASDHGHTASSRQLELCWYIDDMVDVLYRAVARTHRTDCEVIDLGSCLTQDIPLTAKIKELHLDRFTTEFVQTQDTINSWNKLKIYKNQLHTIGRGVMKSLSWAKAFESSQEMDMVNRNVVLTSYFTSELDAQRGIRKKSNCFSYISDWYKSVVRLGMSAVIFHDGLGPEFQHKLTQYHPRVSFEYVPSLKGRSTNDARFYSYLKYLEHHPDIRHVLLTDIADVSFQMDPFKLMHLLGEWLYIGSDVDTFPNMETMPWMQERFTSCFRNYSVERGLPHTLTQMNTVYNAGVIGGSRELMLTVLTKVVAYLDTTPPQSNCNMPAVNIAVHKHFFERVFTGYPLTSRFPWRQVSPQGVFILHK